MISFLNFLNFQEKLRELQAAAAEKRIREIESKGIKDLDHLKRQQTKKEQTDRLQTSYSNSENGNLRVIFRFWCYQNIIFE